MSTNYEITGGELITPKEESNMILPPEKSDRKDVTTKDMLLFLKTEINSRKEEMLVKTAKRNAIKNIPVEKIDIGRDTGR